MEPLVFILLILGTLIVLIWAARAANRNNSAASNEAIRKADKATEEYNRIRYGTKRGPKK